MSKRRYSQASTARMFVFIIPVTARHHVPYPAFPPFRSRGQLGASRRGGEACCPSVPSPPRRSRFKPQSRRSGGGEGRGWRTAVPALQAPNRPRDESCQRKNPTRPGPDTLGSRPLSLSPSCSSGHIQLGRSAYVVEKTNLK